MVLIVYIMVSKSTWGFPLDQLLLAKLLLCLVDLHVFKFISLWIIRIDLISIIPYFASLTIFYTTQCFTFFIVVFVCAGYRFRR